MAELNVTKKSIGVLFGEMQRRQFVIPDYQRPYQWDREKCDILWQDLIEFFLTQRPEQNQEQEYYLGTIVTCHRDDGTKKELLVIDGQQRLTSLLLLLRAFYKMLEGMDPAEPRVMGLRSQIAPCIWDVDPISGQVPDPNRIHLESLVATAADNDALRAILRSGMTEDDAEDSYSSNYRLFLQWCQEFAKRNPMDWQPLCVAILRNCIILPIECEKFDTALTIFSTLNDRGLPLSDSDIFKVQIYRSRSSPDEQQCFTDAWKELMETVETSGISLDDLFRYYTHVIRARAQNTAKEIGLRAFYAGETRKFSLLQSPRVMDELARLAECWRIINTGGDADWLDLDSKKWIHCLQFYPNEYWKYVLSVYFFSNLQPVRNDGKLSRLLRLLVSWLYSKFLFEPTVNAIKDPCYHLMIDVLAGKPLTSPEPLPDGIANKLTSAYDSKIARGLLLIHAYLHPDQSGMLPSKFEIEHIFPRKWQETNYRGWSYEDATASLECFGNKVVCEKKINVQASNDYFGRKKLKYADSKIAAVRTLCIHASNDWAKSDIDARDKQFASDIVAFFKTNMSDAGAQKT